MEVGLDELGGFLRGGSVLTGSAVAERVNRLHIAVHGAHCECGLGGLDLGVFNFELPLISGSDSRLGSGSESPSVGSAAEESGVAAGDSSGSCSFVSRGNDGGFHGWMERLAKPSGKRKSTSKGLSKGGSSPVAGGAGDGEVPLVKCEARDDDGRLLTPVKLPRVVVADSGGSSSADLVNSNSGGDAVAAGCVPASNCVAASSVGGVPRSEDGGDGNGVAPEGACGSDGGVSAPRVAKVEVTDDQDALLAALTEVAQHVGGVEHGGSCPMPNCSCGDPCGSLFG